MGFETKKRKRIAFELFTNLNMRVYLSSNSYHPSPNHHNFSFKCRFSFLLHHNPNFSWLANFSQANELKVKLWSKKQYNLNSSFLYYADWIVCTSFVFTSCFLFCFSFFVVFLLFSFSFTSFLPFFNLLILRLKRLFTYL